MKPLRHQGLSATKELRVERQLQHGAAARLASELSVEDLVRPRPQGARRTDSSQDIWTAEPSSTTKRRLDNGIRTVAHRFPCPRDRIRLPNPEQVDNHQTLTDEALNVRLLMLEPALL